MKKLASIVSLVTLAACMTGCMALSVPRTTITGNIGGQPFTLSSPKDSELTGLTITASSNGVVSIKLEHLTAKMNPEVITTTADAQVKMMQTAGDLALKGVAAAAGK